MRRFEKTEDSPFSLIKEIFSGRTIQQRWWGEDSRAALGQNVDGWLLRRGGTETCAPIWQMSQFGRRLCREVAKSVQTFKSKEIFKMLYFYAFMANRNLPSGHASYVFAQGLVWILNLSNICTHVRAESCGTGNHSVMTDKALQTTHKWEIELMHRGGPDKRSIWSSGAASRRSVTHNRGNL
jgi:hypothetical protein